MIYVIEGEFKLELMGFRGNEENEMGWLTMQRPTSGVRTWV